MRISESITKRMRIILESCVCKLKEFYPKNDGNEFNSRIIKVENIHCNIADQSIYDNSFNISLLDQYFLDNSLSTDSGFIRLIQKIEINTEINIIQLLIESLDSMDNFINIFDKSNRVDLVKFNHYPPSPLRTNEERLVVGSTIDEELNECNIDHSNSDCTLYGKALLVIEEKQKKAINTVFDRFESMVERIRQCQEQKEITAHKEVLFSALSARKDILELKKKNFVC